MPIRKTLSGKGIAAALELLVPGAGHFTLGARKQALFWFAATGIPWLCFIAAALVGSLIGFWVAACVMILARLTGVAHCFFVRGQDFPPWWKVAVATGAAGAVVLCMIRIAKTEFVSAFEVPSGSMQPAIRFGDRLVVSRLHRKPKRGDIVAFLSPRDGGTEQDTYLKRVVALGGDTVQVTNSMLLVNNRRVTTNRRLGSCTFTAQCELLEESIEGTTYPIMLTHEGLVEHDLPAALVPPATVFVLGDNRDNSLDSRSFGPVPMERIIGRFQFTWLSSNGEEK